MHPTNERPAEAASAGLRVDAQTGQAAHAPHRAHRADPQQVRVRFAGREHPIRFDAADPNWRMKALADLHPLSDRAFAIRKVALQRAERRAIGLMFEMITLTLMLEDLQAAARESGP